MVYGLMKNSAGGFRTYYRSSAVVTSTCLEAAYLLLNCRLNPFGCAILLKVSNVPPVPRGLVFFVGGYEANAKGGSDPGMIIVRLLLLVGAAVLVGRGMIRPFLLPCRGFQATT